MNSHTKAVEIITPPQDIRIIIDKTSQFVANNGYAFEQKILNLQEGNKKFNFLLSNNPYYPYYQDRVNKLINKSENITETASSVDNHHTESITASTEENCGIKLPGDSIEKPDDEIYTINIPPNLSELEIDVIRLTAQFTAKNGKAFLTGLYQREQNNPLFSFIRPNNSLFSLFTNMVDKYLRVINPSKKTQDLLSTYAEDRKAILIRCLKRLEYERENERTREKAEKIAEKERTEMMSVDWHDFTVVETIEFFEAEDENLPEPLSLKDVISLKQYTQNKNNHNSPSGTIDTSKFERDIGHLQDEESNILKSSIKSDLVPLQDPSSEFKVVKDYVRRPSPSSNMIHYVRSPLTHEMVRINDMAEHMRVNLIDPRWEHQTKLMLGKIKETAKASDDEIVYNVLSLAKHRPDIFGSTKDEVNDTLVKRIELNKTSAYTYSNKFPTKAPSICLKTKQSICAPAIYDSTRSREEIEIKEKAVKESSIALQSFSDTHLETKVSSAREKNKTFTDLTENCHIHYSKDSHYSQLNQNLQIKNIQYIQRAKEVAKISGKSNMFLTDISFASFDMIRERLTERLSLSLSKINNSRKTRLKGCF